MDKEKKSFEKFLLENKEWDWSYDKIYVKPNIPSKKLNNALSYASGVVPEDVLILIDDTVFGGARDGILVTRDAIYCHEIMTPMRRIFWSDVKKIEMGSKSQVLVNKNYFFKGNIVDHSALLAITSRIDSVLKTLYSSGVKVDDKYISKREVKDFDFPEVNINSLFFIKYEQNILRDIKKNGVSGKSFLFFTKILELSKSIAVDFQRSKCFDHNLVRVINHDATILTAFNWCFYATKNILVSNGFNAKKIESILAPLMFIQYYYITHKYSAYFNTLAAKANPQKIFRDTKEYKAFDSVGFSYSRAYELRGLVDGSLEHFTQEVVSALFDEHSMLFEYLHQEGFDGMKQLEKYCREYAASSHTRCEALLLELLS